MRALLAGADGGGRECPASDALPSLLGCRGGRRMTLSIADRRVFRLGLILCIGIIVADQISKAIILAVMEQHPFGIPVLPFFSLVEAWNPGVSFSMLRFLPPEA